MAKKVEDIDALMERLSYLYTKREYNRLAIERDEEIRDKVTKELTSHYTNRDEIRAEIGAIVRRVAKEFSERGYQD